MMNKKKLLRRQKMYQVYRCKSLKNNSKNSSVHYSKDAEKTLCGKNLNEYWYIMTNDLSINFVNCNKCLKLLKKAKDE